MRVAIDAMGGDYAPQATVEGAVLYAKETEGKHQLLLLGDQPTLEKELSHYSVQKWQHISIHHTTQIVEMSDSPTSALKQKPDSSLMKALQMHKNGEVDAVVSAGSTGAQMVGSLMILGRIEGVHRPALGSFLPTEGGVVLLIDVGANVDCKPINLLQFGLMGSIFINYIYGISNPRVGLLSHTVKKKPKVMNWFYPPILLWPPIFQTSLEIWRGRIFWLAKPM